VVSAVGADVKDLKVGDEVFGVLEAGRDGTYCEKIAIGAAIVAKKPSPCRMSTRRRWPSPVSRRYGRSRTR
jgi:NADPH:quinone reductase-like Zn-dependent oxidoreductase